MPFHQEFVPPSWKEGNDQPKNSMPSPEELAAHGLLPGSTWEDLQNKIREEDDQLPQGELKRRLFDQEHNKAA